MSNDLKVSCPFCNGTMWIDPLTGKIMHQEETAGDQSENFTDFLAGAHKQEDVLAAKFKQAKEKETRKLQELEEQFKWAQNNADKIKNDGGPHLI